MNAIRLVGVPGGGHVWVRRCTRCVPAAPHARELGADRELEGIRTILADGNSADGQLHAYAANGDITAVAAHIAEQTIRFRRGS